MSLQTIYWSGSDDTNIVTTQSAGTIVMHFLQSPIGELAIGATERGLCLLEYADRDCLPAQVATLEKLLRARTRLGLNPYIQQASLELARYFDGELCGFDTPLEIVGTPFEYAVWKCLREIPYGNVASYSRIAAQCGHPGAQRAVGRANGSNKMAIVIPCHRVVKASGSLSGYGGGLWRKEFLLSLERKHATRLLL